MAIPIAPHFRQKHSNTSDFLSRLEEKYSSNKIQDFPCRERDFATIREFASMRDFTYVSEI